jgi:hypothetical protein
METPKDYSEKLDVIFEMIENSKTNLRDNSFFYLLWGWLTLAASLIHFTLLKMGFFYSFLAWPVIMTAGSIVSTIAGFRLGQRNHFRTHLDTAMIYLWWGFFFTLLVPLVFAIAGKIPWNIANALIISLYGLGTFASGGMLKFKPLIIGGICCWIICLGVFFVPEDYSLLLISLSIVISYLVPGYLLRSAR